jgi:hypothetical protein
MCRFGACGFFNIEGVINFRIGVLSYFTKGYAGEARSAQSFLSFESLNALNNLRIYKLVALLDYVS